MHIEARGAGKKKKYYLSHSYRDGGRVRKTRAYLGANLSKAEVRKKAAVAVARLRNRIDSAKVIRDPFKTVLSSGEIKELENLEIKSHIGIIHLGKEEWRKFSKAFTFDTNAIEGSSVNPNEVGQILEKNQWPANLPRNEISETYGVADAIDYTRKTRDHISLELIKHLHWLCFKNSKPFAGKLRGKNIEVVIQDGFGNVVHRGTPSSQVPSLLKELINWYEKNRKKYPPLVLAAVVHNQFENIHPFQDGNGRVGRLLLNNILIKNSLPPLNIELKHRREYYDSLQQYHEHRNLRPTIELMLKEYSALKQLLKKR